jgi:hypothetical protein
MLKIKKFTCNILKNKIYLVLYKESSRGVGYVYRRYTRQGATYYGFFEVCDNGDVDNDIDNGSDLNYLEYVQDFLDYNFKVVDVYEFNTLKETKDFISKYILVRKLSK